MLPPARDGLFVSPERQRQYLARLGQAFEALNRNETIHIGEFRPQGRRKINQLTRYGTIIVATVAWPP